MKFDLSFILSLVGALAWTPVIIGWLKKDKLSGKIISQYLNFAELPLSNKGSGAIYLLKLALFSKNRDFYFKSIHIYVKYPNEEERIGKNWIWRHLRFVIDDINGKSDQKQLLISSTEYISSQTVLPKGEIVSGYLSFSTNKTEDIPYEYIKLVFYNYNGKSQEVVFYHNELEPNAVLFDESIWGNI
jgi:hypothetical protein